MVGKGRYKRKAYFSEGACKKFSLHGNGKLTAGMKGVLITVGNVGGLKRCMHEALMLIKEYVGNEQAESGNFSNVDAARAADSLDSAVSALRNRDSIHPEMESSIRIASTDVKNTIFVVLPDDVHPVDLVVRILTDVKLGKRTPSNFLQRILPCELSCSAFGKNIGKAAKELLEQRLSKVIVDQCPTFAVAYKCRNNSSVKRQEVYDAIVQPFTTLSPGSRVSLTAPKYSILVNIVKDVCCLSLVENYIDLKCFNWNSLYCKRNSDTGQ